MSLLGSIAGIFFSKQTEETVKPDWLQPGEQAAGCADLLCVSRLLILTVNLPTCMTPVVRKRLQNNGVRGLETDNAHKPDTNVEPESRICIEVSKLTFLISTARSARQLLGSFINLIKMQRLAIITRAVGNTRSVSSQQQGQQTDFWNVPCELHSMWCTSKYTIGATEMSFFKVTGAPRRQIVCLTLRARWQKWPELVAFRF